MDSPSKLPLTTLAPWTLDPDFDLEATHRQLVASQYALLGAFQHLRTRLAEGGNDIHIDLAKVQGGLLQVDSAIKAFLPPRYFNELRPSHAALEPHRALNTTEILESILVQLNIRDLLTARQINRKFRAVISSTQSLQ